MISKYWKGLIIRSLSISGLCGLMAMSSVNEVKAQKSRSQFIPYSTVGVGVGTSSYYGDLAPYRRVLASTFKMVRFNVSGEYTRHFTPRIAGRASLTWARMAGDDFVMNKNGGNVNHFIRNLHFRNDIKELAVVGIYKLTPDNRTSENRPVFSPYIFAGIGVFAHNPKARLPYANDEKGEWVSLQSVGTEGQGAPNGPQTYSLVNMSIPLGFGVRYKINKKIDIGAELGFRFTTTDYIDDVSMGYPNPAVIAGSTNNFTQALSNRSFERFPARKPNEDRTAILAEKLGLGAGADGIAHLQANPGLVTTRGTNANRNDSFMTGTIKVTYTLGSSVKCPPIKY